MLKTTGSSVTTASRVDNNEVVGGGGAGAESGGSICQRVHQTNQVTRKRSKTSWESSADIGFASEGLIQLQTTKRIELLNGGPRDNLWLGLGGQECPHHDLRRVFGIHQYFGINNYPIDLAF